MNSLAGVAQTAVALAAKHLRAAFGQRGETAPTVAPDLAQVIDADDAGILALSAQLTAGRDDRSTLVEQLATPCRPAGDRGGGTGRCLDPQRPRDAPRALR